MTDKKKDSLEWLAFALAVFAYLKAAVRLWITLGR